MLVVTTLLLVRHGETDWNRDRRLQGHADPELNGEGLRQADELARSLAVEPPAAVYASDLRRARRTAEVVAERLGLPVATDARLREIDVGEWSGLHVHEVAERFPAGYTRWRELTGHGWERGETYDELGARVLAALSEIAARHPGETVLVVTHGGPIRAVAAAAAGVGYAEARRTTPVVANCVVTRFAVEDGAIRRID